jgi:hypothetical protein
VLGAASLADEAAFVALSDLVKAVGKGPDLEYRVIGGIMVTLHTQRWRLGPLLYRQTGDADLGVPPAGIRDAGILARLKELGYKKVAGNRFERPLDRPAESPAEDGPTRVAAIDVLVPAYTSRARDNVRVGELQTTEVRGLALALNRPPIQVALRMMMLDGKTTLTAAVLLPDEVSALVLRAYAWHVRGEDKDAVDLWRALEIASAAGVTLETITGEDAARASDLIGQAFLSPGTGLRQLTRARGLSQEAQAQMKTRLKALVTSVAALRPPPSGGAEPLRRTI